MSSRPALQVGIAAVLGVALLPGLAGCGATTAATPSGGAASAAVDRPATTAAAAPANDAIDACADAPAAPLQAVTGADPGEGVAEKGRIDGGQCTWKVSDTHTALLQVTRRPDQYLPKSIYPKPKGANAIDGADRGWASADRHTILVVKHGRGALFTDIGFGTKGAGGQQEYDALAAAIAAKL